MREHGIMLDGSELYTPNPKLQTLTSKLWTQPLKFEIVRDKAGICGP